MGLAILEFEPQWRTIFTYDHGGLIKTWRLPFPRLLFCVWTHWTVCRPAWLVFSNLMVLRAHNSVRDWDWPVYGGFLPNQAEEGSVCLGTFDYDYQDHDRLIRDVIGRFWSSAFVSSDGLADWQAAGRPTNGTRYKLRQIVGDGWGALEVRR